MAWDPAQYLKFAGERMRPALDLIARVPLAAPRTIVDLGCGTGNVTRLLAQRWPEALITGVDNSTAMLERARRDAESGRAISWRCADLAQWAADALESPPDLVFSNAALHWLDGHAELFPRIFSAVAAGGALAVQMPDQFAAPSHVALRDTACSARWRDQLAPALRPPPVASMDDYFCWLTPGATAIDAWTTEYLHVLPAVADGEHPVVAWTRGTALTPFLARLDASLQQAFVDDYRVRIAAAYPSLADGRVLFPFRRRFLVAVRG